MSVTEKAIIASGVSLIFAAAVGLVIVEQADLSPRYGADPREPCVIEITPGYGALFKNNTIGAVPEVNPVGLDLGLHFLPTDSVRIEIRNCLFWTELPYSVGAFRFPFSFKELEEGRFEWIVSDSAPRTWKD